MTKSTPPNVSGALPVLGHAAEFQRDRPGLIRRGFVEHGSVFAIKLAKQNVAVVIGPTTKRSFLWKQTAV